MSMVSSIFVPAENTSVVPRIPAPADLSSENMFGYSTTSFALNSALRQAKAAPKRAKPIGADVDTEGAFIVVSILPMWGWLCFNIAAIVGGNPLRKLGCVCVQ
ncbi:hypothetical protein D3C85_1588040 [compost metagenome]